MGKLSDGKSGESKYLKAGNLQEGQEVTLTMSHIAAETIQRDGEDDQHKYVLYFIGKELGLVLNNTNIDVLIDCYGDDLDTIPSKQIVLFHTTTSYKNKTVPCLRLRRPTEQVNADEIPF